MVMYPPEAPGMRGSGGAAVLRRMTGFGLGEPGEVAAWARKTRHESGLHGILAELRRDDRNRVGRPPRDEGRAFADGDDDVDALPHELGG